MNVKHISELENGLIKQVVSERRGLIISTATLFDHCMVKTEGELLGL